MKKAIVVILAVILVFAAIGTGVYFGFCTGECGDNVKWSFNPINKTLTISGEGAMYDYEINEAPWLKESFIIPVNKVVVEEGVTYIGEYAFSSTLHIESVSLPEGVIKIGDHAFAGAGLKSLILPNSLECIGKQSFMFNAFSEVIIPEKVTEIGMLAFEACFELKSVNVKGSISVLEERVFENCHKLEKLCLPSSVKEIKSEVFSGIDTLDIVFDGTQEQWDKILIEDKDNPYVMPECNITYSK